MSAATSQRRLLAYLASVRRRESARLTLVFASALLSVLILLTAAAVLLGIQRGFTEALTYGTRAVLVIASLTLLLMLFWRPLRSLIKDRGAWLVENADAAFDGRIRTWVDTRERTPGNEFLPLLAQDGLTVARRVPPSRIVPASAILMPLLAVMLAVGSVVYFARHAPPEIRNAALHIWWGWQQPGLVIPRQVAVAPGDADLLAGENLPIDIRLEGFVQREITLHVKQAGSDWQSTTVQADADEAFRYTVFAVEQPLQYRVSAAYTESEVFDVSVTVPTRVQRIEAA